VKQTQQQTQLGVVAQRQLGRGIAPGSQTLPVLAADQGPRTAPGREALDWHMKLPPMQIQRSGQERHCCHA
jgi:hypothetical protein